MTINELAIKDPFELDTIVEIIETVTCLHIRRLIGIGFNDQGKVLDAGCGYGQWSIAIESLNNDVVGIDMEPKE